MSQTKTEKKTVNEIVHEIVLDFLTQLGLDAEITIDIVESDEDKADFKYARTSLNGENLGEIIGFRGTMLESIQTILSLILNKTLKREGIDGNFRLLIDINAYKQQREKYLISYAQRAAEDVKRCV